MNPETKDNTTIYLVIGGLLLLCICCCILSSIGGAIYYSYNSGGSSSSSGSSGSSSSGSSSSGSSSSNPIANLFGKVTGKAIIPKLGVINDCGYSTQTRGWYDIQNQGAKNDYCRYVGGGAQPAWFSCALAGATNQYTPITQYIDPNSPHDPPSSTLPCPA
jgi:hypothetical protein